MTKTQDSSSKLGYLLLGIALPLVVFVIWARTGGLRRKAQIDQAHDITVEDSFPASDPPSAW